MALSIRDGESLSSFALHSAAIVMLMSAEMTAQDVGGMIGILNLLTKLRCTGDSLSAFRKICSVTLPEISYHQRLHVRKPVPLPTILSKLCCQYGFHATSW